MSKACGNTIASNTAMAVMKRGCDRIHLMREVLSSDQLLAMRYRAWGGNKQDQKQHLNLTEKLATNTKAQQVINVDGDVNYAAIMLCTADGSILLTTAQTVKGKCATLMGLDSGHCGSNLLNLTWKMWQTQVGECTKLLEKKRSARRALV